MPRWARTSNARSVVQCPSRRVAVWLAGMRTGLSVVVIAVSSRIGTNWLTPTIHNQLVIVNYFAKILRTGRARRALGLPA
ncbi:hypothetical protein GCM10022220_34440 [Actinocatenispora rupis]|uniref:Uncharacterized protein n=1 Tax=Actinocatenispora rupis TaxID=519421 RepID=A0A8J3JA84_9ACTN|nr:hypothetical protein Aru02nite_38430 [Actinocatenispora rupis]